MLAHVLRGQGRDEMLTGGLNGGHGQGGIGQGEREGGSEIQRTWRPLWLEHRALTQADLKVRP